MEKWGWFFSVNERTEKREIWRMVLFLDTRIMPFGTYLVAVCRGIYWRCIRILGRFEYLLKKNK